MADVHSKLSSVSLIVVVKSVLPTGNMNGGPVSVGLVENSTVGSFAGSMVEIRASCGDVTGTVFS